MTRVSPDLRNQHTTLDATRAKNRVARKCQKCGTGIGAQKRYCAPCYAVSYDEKLAARREKYRK